MSPTEQIEIERKYDVGDLVKVPDLAGVGPVVDVSTEPAFDLRAVYYDTAEHLLLANRITLRRREGGHDQGWHVKLPAGLGARREVHAPLGSNPAEPLPQEVRRVVEVVLRGRPVHPVLVLETKRTLTLLHDASGRQLAEVADDAVTATRTGAATSRRWREWEVELAEGVARADGEALFDAVGDALESAGASVSGSKSKLARGLGSVPDTSAVAPAGPVALPKKSAGAFLVQALVPLIADLTALDPQVRNPDARSESQDPVHRFRTTVRRLRSLLRVYRGVLDDDETAWLVGRLAEVGRAAGAARDLDVAARLLSQFVDAAPAGWVPPRVVERLESGNGAAARDAGRAVEGALTDPAYFELLDRLDRVVSVAPSGPRSPAAAAEFVASRLARETRRARRLVRRAARVVGPVPLETPLDTETLHEGRKAARRLRYALEAAREARVSGIGGSRAVKTAHHVQDALGDALDAATAMATYVAAVPRVRGAREDAFGRGVLATMALTARDAALGRLLALARRL